MRPKKMSFYDYCIANDKLALLNEWDKRKNEELTPQNVSYKNSKKIWWKCEEGHEWQAAVFNRANGTGCPYCAQQRSIKEGRDLATMAPAVAAQWHPTKNGELTPETTGAQSKKRVWWQCKEGHEWQAIVCNRTNGTGCPYCAKGLEKEGNDLATAAPEIAAQWHPTLNMEFSPETITAKSGKKIWWRCQEGHEWQATPHNRSKGVGCPFCYPKTNKATLAKHREMLREAKEKLGQQD